jgi:predicted nucleic acid-binding protein
MVLVDTSVWVDHFRSSSPVLETLLDDGQVLVHPFITGELACGNLRNRTETFTYLHALPAAIVASNVEAITFLEKRRLWGRGLGWVDVHLLASALLSRAAVWTIDKRLRTVAAELGVGPDGQLQ